MFDKFDTHRALGTAAAAGSQYAMCHYIEPRKWYTILGTIAASTAIGYGVQELAADMLAKKGAEKTN